MFSSYRYIYSVVIFPYIQVGVVLSTHMLHIRFPSENAPTCKMQVEMPGSCMVTCDYESHFRIEHVDLARSMYLHIDRNSSLCRYVDLVVNMVYPVTESHAVLNDNVQYSLDSLLSASRSERLLRLLCNVYSLKPRLK